MSVVDICIISPTKKAIIPLLKILTEKARVAFSFDNLKRGSLISIGQLCDDDCIAIFTKYDVKIIRLNEILIRGKQTDNGLWKIPLSNNQPTLVSIHPEAAAEKQVENWIIKWDTTKSELADYYAATLLNLVKSTLLRAICNNYLTSWPALTTRLISTHLSKRLTAVQGHMDHGFKNLRSTKPVKNDVQEVDSTLEQEKNNIKTHDVMCAKFSAEELSKLSSDQTGKCPITSSRGNKYIFVFYHYDTNTINGIAIKSCNTTDICDAWQTAYELLKSHGEAPNIHILDNKCSRDMKTIFKEAHVEYQLVPPNIHRHNAA